MYPIQFHKEIKIMNEIEKKESEPTEAELLSRLEIMPEWIAVHAVTHCKHNGRLPEGVTTSNLLNTVLEQGRDIKKDEKHRIERQLYSQGVALSLMFDKLMRLMGLSETLKQMETYGHLALKAQAQSRATFVALNQLNNPNGTTFIKQQNNAVNQQINESKLAGCTNELLTERPNETLDLRGKAGTIPQNTFVVPMGEIDRPYNKKG
jgi:hypothetical protein